MPVDAAAWSRLREIFDRNFQAGVEVGASVAVWQDGEEKLCLVAGWRDAARSVPWDHDTLVLVWSATKGLASACLLHALEKKGYDLSTLVVKFWPEFGQAGKEELTVGEVVSHRAGLAALDDVNLSVLDHAGVAAAIEQQAPFWKTGEGHGYGPRTYGFITDEMVRRLSGQTLGEYWRHHFGDPLELDLWIGLPEKEHHRVAQILTARAGCSEAESDFVQAMSTPGSLTRIAFSSPGGMMAPSAMNAAAVRSASIPSFGGIGSASALAKFYAVLAQGGKWGGTRYFSPQILEWMTTRMAQGLDQTLRTETAFSGGFMMDPTGEDGKKRRFLMGPSLKAFGHPGAGGSLAFADPEQKIGFAYVMNQMEMGVLPGTRARLLVSGLYDLPANSR